MARNTFVEAERNILELLAVATIVILFWIGTWGLTEEMIDRLHKTYNVSKLKLYLTLMGGVIIILVVFPHILDRI